MSKIHHDDYMSRISKKYLYLAINCSFRKMLIWPNGVFSVHFIGPFVHIIIAASKKKNCEFVYLCFWSM